MAVIQDHAYLKICAALASQLSISQSSARKQVDLAALKEGVRDLEARKAIANKLLQKAKTLSQEGKLSAGMELDRLLVALGQDENFMVED